MLTKLGCNAGACHGSFKGRGELRLSLLGFDPAADYQALTKEARGRRVFPAAPERSLLLAKPTLSAPHGGGKRLDEGSAAYKILRDWITAGLPGPQPGDPQVVRLEIAPAEAVLAVGQQADIGVRAVWDDGSTADVTEWAVFESRDEPLAEVSKEGRIVAQAVGRTSITVRYQGQVAAIPVTMPYAHMENYPELPVWNPIDQFLAAEWRKLGLLPAPLADDAEFVRRVFLDLAGTLPTPDEVRTFVADAAPQQAKRAQLIDRLLERPEYVDHWALKWSDLLRIHRRALGEKGLASFQGWLRQSLRSNAPFDRIVRELLTAEGNLYASGPVAYYFIDKTPEEFAETTAQVFLGVRLQCAKCHHHPFDQWSQEDYYGMAAFFSRVERKDTREGGAFGGAQSIKVGAGAPVRHPGTGQEIAPRALGWTPPSDNAPRDVRQSLAAWITSPENPRFARNVVNRYWGYLFGRGLVHPLDDLSATNPPSQPELLAWLERDFVEHGYDLKHLLRTLCNSRAYQLASELDAVRDADGAFFTHRVPRRLPAEVLLDAVNQVAGTSEPFENLPPGQRAISLPDTAVASYFLDTFGRPRRINACECDRASKPDLGQVLHLANSESIHAKVTAPQGRLAKLLEAGKDQTEIVGELYLAAFSRLPDDSERQTAASYIAAAPTPKEGLEDLLWTLLNCPEFTFNH